MTMQRIYDDLQNFLKRITQNKIFFTVIGILLLGLVVLSHVYLINDLPRGLYIDEVSIGLNAATLAESGNDEYGTKLPLYFKAFGEYKNPVYIYAAGILFKIFGENDQVLRMTSFFFFAILLTAGTFLASLLIRRKSFLVISFSLLGLGFLPQYFTISRVSFEVISHPAFVAIFLALAYLAYDKQKITDSPDSFKLKQNLLPLATGIMLGLTVYTYSTARLLTPLTLILLVFLYRKKEFFTRNVYVLIGFVVSYIPWIINFTLNPLSQLSRFGGITYLGNPNLNAVQKLGEFFYNYFSYFSPSYLFINGDANLRHSIGFGGIVFVGILIPAIFGLFQIISKSTWTERRFEWFIAISLFISPLAATLTEEGTPHLLRSSLVGLYLFLLAVIGLREFVSQKNYSMIVLTFLLLLIEIPNFLGYYFIKYPSISAEAFGSYGYTADLNYALAQNPTKIVVSKSKNGGLSYALVDYYNHLQSKPNIPVVLGDIEYSPKTCFIYFAEDGERVNNLPKVSFKAYEIDGQVSSVRCYD